MDRIYYVPPADHIFNEVKEKAKEIWNTYDNSFGYVTEKISRLEKVENIKDNMMHIVAMFDTFNQKRLSLILSNEACYEIRIRMLDGQVPEEYIVF